MKKNIKFLCIMALLFIASLWYYFTQRITISVIVPAYNAEKYISRCIDSIINQDGNFEIVVINDGSTDSTSEILKKYAQKYPFIKVINQSNKGVAAARNSGLKAASSKYITFVDSDDWLEPNALKLAIKQIKKHNPDMLITGYYDVYDKEWVKNTRGEEATKFVADISKYPTNVLDKMSLFSPFLAKEALNDLYYTGVGVRGQFFKKEFLSNTKITFTQGLDCYEDDVFVVSLLLHNPLVSILDKPIYNYLNRIDSISKNKNTLTCGRKSRKAILSSSAFLSSSRKEKMLIEDLFISYIFLSLANYRRHNLPLDDISAEAITIYTAFDKYNIAERRSLRNYLKLHKLLYGNAPSPLL